MSKPDIAPIPHPTSHIPRTGLIATFLFILALLPRLPGLGLFLTSDENTNIFFAGSDVIVAFLRGDFRGTYWHFYPGVTMSWLDALGMAGQYLFVSLSGAKLPPFEEYVYGDILSLLVASRLPYAILTAAAVPAIYLLARQLLPGRVALLGALFLAFDPFYLAHSRVAHGDAPLAVFMSLSALTFFIYIKRTNEAVSQRISEKQSSLSSFILHSSPFLIASAIFGGLAGLTKAPGPFMALFIIGMSIICMGVDLFQVAGSRWQTVGITPGAPQATHHALRTTHKDLFVIAHWLKVIITWGLIALAVFILLWPAMWVDPAGTIGRMWAETFGKVNEGHLVYFFGQPSLDPGPWFYFYVIPFRLTPIVFIGALLSLALLVPKIMAFADSEKLPLYASRFTLYFLWLFILSLLFFANLSPKKQDRYLLPLFPFLDLLAAVGWVGLFNLAQYFMRPKTSPSIYPLLPTTYYLLLLLCHFIPTITYYPYYLTYFNPLMGGPVRAAQTTLLGWGEGMEQAAAYLNTKPDAERLYVASTPSQTLLPYFAGIGENFYTNDIAFRADYVVLYLAQMQRLAPSPEIINYFQAQEPEKTIVIHGVTYAKIYPGPKLILSDIPPDAMPVNIGLNNVMRLAGYKISNLQSPVSNPQLSLYWHALSPLSTN
ncbi:MAG TPA: glycosyltransferase family 39 protein, partial [Anaerolineae bacterium]|nr:glycosyltransferase family 39 protein [Anaerolineae bacterium]